MQITAHDVASLYDWPWPKGAIIIDESLTSGGTYWDQSAGCPQFSHLTLTGKARYHLNISSKCTVYLYHRGQTSSIYGNFGISQQGRNMIPNGAAR
jgi:hypothetical protein